jgi:two-component system, LytTR family, sensor kinase
MRFFTPLRPLLYGWLLSFAGWGLVGVILGLNFIGGTDIPWTRALHASLRDQLPWALLTPLLFRFAMRHLIDGATWRKNLLLHLLVGTLTIWAIHQWKILLDPGPGPHSQPARIAEEDFDPQRGRSLAPPPPAWDFFHFASVEIPIYLMILSGAHTLHFYRRAEIRKGQLATAQLQALQAQLRPHFLFNTLNTIAGLVHKAPDKADAVLTMLSDLLRSSLESSTETQVPLAREMEFVQKYLAIMRVRYEDRVESDVQIAPDTVTALVPTLLLQPIVENAIKYGIEPNPNGGKIHIESRRDGNALCLTVTNTGAGFRGDEEVAEGIGLSNTRARLRELFGKSASISFSNTDGVMVQITIPFRTRT